MIAIQLYFALPEWFGRIEWQGIADFVEGCFLAARPCVENQDSHALIRPFPVFDLRQIVAALVNVLLVLNQFVAHILFEVTSDAL